MKKHARYLALAVTLGVMALIFFLSAQPAEVSYHLSEVVTETVQASHREAWLPQWFNAQSFHANLRKWAHVYIYCALGVSVAVTVQFWTRRLSLPQRALLSSALCMLYAVSDELHQCFVPGRAMLLSDVGVDALGFLPCATAVYLGIWLYRKRR